MKREYTMKITSLKVPGCVVFLALLGVCEVYAQSAGRNVVIETNRKELDTILLRKPIPPGEDTSLRQAKLQQINDDFKALQTLNNKVMNAITGQGEVDYKSIGGWIGEIKNKATRLKSNLVLPKASKDERDLKEPELELKDQLLALDKVVESFVQNPIFQNTNVVEVGSATKASNDLARIIEGSGKLKKAITQLAK